MKVRIKISKILFVVILMIFEGVLYGYGDYVYTPKVSDKIANQSMQAPRYQFTDASQPNYIKPNFNVGALQSGPKFDASNLSAESNSAGGFSMPVSNDGQMIDNAMSTVLVNNVVRSIQSKSQSGQTTADQNQFANKGSNNPDILTDTQINNMTSDSSPAVESAAHDQNAAGSLNLAASSPVLSSQTMMPNISVSALSRPMGRPFALGVFARKGSIMNFVPDKGSAVVQPTKSQAPLLLTYDSSFKNDQSTDKAESVSKVDSIEIVNPYQDVSENKSIVAQQSDKNNLVTPVDVSGKVNDQSVDKAESVSKVDSIEIVNPYQDVSDNKSIVAQQSDKNNLVTPVDVNGKVNDQLTARQGAASPAGVADVYNEPVVNQVENKSSQFFNKQPVNLNKDITSSNAKIIEKINGFNGVENLNLYLESREFADAFKELSSAEQDTVYQFIDQQETIIKSKDLKKQQVQELKAQQKEQQLIDTINKVNFLSDLSSSSIKDIYNQLSPEAQSRIDLVLTKKYEELDAKVYNYQELLKNYQQPLIDILNIEIPKKTKDIASFKITRAAQAKKNEKLTNFYKNNIKNIIDNTPDIVARQEYLDDFYKKTKAILLDNLVKEVIKDVPSEGLGMMQRQQAIVKLMTENIEVYIGSLIDLQFEIDYSELVAKYKKENELSLSGLNKTELADRLDRVMSNMLKKRIQEAIVEKQDDINNVNKIAVKLVTTNSVAAQDEKAANSVAPQAAKAPVAIDFEKALEQVRNDAEAAEIKKIKDFLTNKFMKTEYSDYVEKFKDTYFKETKEEPSASQIDFGVENHLNNKVLVGVKSKYKQQINEVVNKKVEDWKLDQAKTPEQKLAEISLQRKIDVAKSQVAAKINKEILAKYQKDNNIKPGVNLTQRQLREVMKLQKEALDLPENKAAIEFAGGQVADSWNQVQAIQAKQDASKSLLM